jgi:hypothetical protein
VSGLLAVPIRTLPLDADPVTVPDPSLSPRPLHVRLTLAPGGTLPTDTGLPGLMSRRRFVGSIRLPER